MIMRWIFVALLATGTAYAQPTFSGGGGGTPGSAGPAGPSGATGAAGATGPAGPAGASGIASLACTAPIVCSGNAVSLQSTTPTAHTSTLTTFTPVLLPDGTTATIAELLALGSGITPAETLAITTPAAQTAGTAFALTGTYTNGPPPALDWAPDGSTWTACAASTISGGAFSCGGVTIAAANAAQTMRVRDHATTTITATSAAFVVNAAGAGLFVVSSVTPNSVGTIGQPMTFAVAYTGTWALPTVLVDGGSVTATSPSAGMISITAPTATTSIRNLSATSVPNQPIHAISVQGANGTAKTSDFAATNTGAAVTGSANLLFPSYTWPATVSGAGGSNVSLYSGVQLGSSSGGVLSSGTTTTGTSPPISRALTGYSLSNTVPPSPETLQNYTPANVASGGATGQYFAANSFTYYTATVPVGSYYVWICYTTTTPTTECLVSSTTLITVTP